MGNPTGLLRVLALANAIVSIAGCGQPTTTRDHRVVGILYEDNYVWLARDRAAVAMKLRKLQRDPHSWLRGTAALYWRDAVEPGGSRPATTFGSPQAACVLLLGDPHVENIGTFRASDGTMFIDWNDFDATGYGPYWLDVRRLAASLAVVAGDRQLAREVIEAMANGYVETIRALAAGARIGTVGFASHPLLDRALTKAQDRGRSHFALDELAPLAGTQRMLAIGDLEPVSSDGVVEDRVEQLVGDEAVAVERAVASWAVGRSEIGRIVTAARRRGSGVASYAALRYNVILDGATPAPDDDLLIELKETRDGVIIAAAPQLAPEWPSPAARAVDTQHRLQARPDGDRLLGATADGGVSLKVRDREAFQRGINATDVGELATSSPESLRELASIYGALLARAHGTALTCDGIAGSLAIAPLLASREAAFASELADRGLAEADQVMTDFTAWQHRDLAAAVVDGDIP